MRVCGVCVCSVCMCGVCVCGVWVCVWGVGVCVYVWWVCVCGVCVLLLRVPPGLTFTILRSDHTLYLCDLYGSENKQLLFPYTALTD